MHLSCVCHASVMRLSCVCHANPAIRTSALCTLEMPKQRRSGDDVTDKRDRGRNHESHGENNDVGDEEHTIMSNADIAQFVSIIADTMSDEPPIARGSIDTVLAQPHGNCPGVNNHHDIGLDTPRLNVPTDVMKKLYEQPNYNSIALFVSNHMETYSAHPLGTISLADFCERYTKYTKTIGYASAFLHLARECGSDPFLAVCLTFIIDSQKWFTSHVIATISVTRVSGGDIGNDILSKVPPMDLMNNKNFVCSVGPAYIHYMMSCKCLNKYFNTQQGTGVECNTDDADHTNFVPSM